MNKEDLGCVKGILYFIISVAFIFGAGWYFNRDNREGKRIKDKEKSEEAHKRVLAFLDSIDRNTLVLVDNDTLKPLYYHYNTQCLKVGDSIRIVTKYDAQKLNLHQCPICDERNDVYDRYMNDDDDYVDGPTYSWETNI